MSYIVYCFRACVVLLVRSIFTDQSGLHCPDGRSLANYTGNVSIMDGGRECEPWPEEEYQIEKQSNHCRDSNDYDTPWCLVSDPILFFQSCTERICGASDHREARCPDGRSLANYTGNVSITDGGRQCQPRIGEDNQTVEHNIYCRTSTGYGLPYCYVSDYFLRYQTCAERICGGIYCGCTYKDIDCGCTQNLCFEAKIRIIESPCGGLLSSPIMLSYQDTTGQWFYEHQKDCLWEIVAPENRIIQLDLTQTDIDCNSNTNLNVFEYPHGQQHPSFLHFECTRDFELSSVGSGVARPGKRIVSSTNVLYVQYDCTSTFLNQNSYDCPGGGFVANISHIIDIEKAICGEDEYMCVDETCIPVEYRCDGTFADCDRGEDEQGCDSAARYNDLTTETILRNATTEKTTEPELPTEPSSNSSQWRQDILSYSLIFLIILLNIGKLQQCTFQ